jgi:hypothetical protein
MTLPDAAVSARPYQDPTPLPDSIPKVDELGATSAPLKSAAFFIGAYCKDYNGVISRHVRPRLGLCSMVSVFVRKRGFYSLQAGGSKSGALSEGR